MNRRAKVEADTALFKALGEYQEILRDGFRFQIAKAQNKDILPMHMWSDWMKWRQRSKAVDEQIEKFYRR